MTLTKIISILIDKYHMQVSSSIHESILILWLCLVQDISTFAEKGQKEIKTETRTYNGIYIN